MNMDEAIIIALGSNLPGAFQTSQALLEAALGGLDQLGLKVTRRSRWWRSAAWPDPSAPAYLNGVALIETPFDARQVLSALHELEQDFGRERIDANAARTLDLDLIAYGRQRLEDGGLVVPHPRAADRLFVMGPLAEIAPWWKHPVYGRTAAVLATQAMVGVDARPLS
jgi:2-amino-4-hydroxy-6-hydroxymethyldihydropteridine diphosphokinase